MDELVCDDDILPGPWAHGDGSINRHTEPRPGGSTPEQARQRLTLDTLCWIQT